MCRSAAVETARTRSVAASRTWMRAADGKRISSRQESRQSLIGSGEGEGNPIRRAHKHDGVGEIQLGVERQIGIKRLERRMGAHQREAAFVHGFGQSHKFEMRGRSRGVRDANKDHRFCVADKNRCFGRDIGRDEFGRLEIGDQALKADVERFHALHATKAAIPIGQPLAGDGAERSDNQAHQRDRHQRLDEREARDPSASGGLDAGLAPSFAGSPDEPDHIEAQRSAARALDGQDDRFRRPGRLRAGGEKGGAERLGVEPPAVTRRLAGLRSVRQLVAPGQPRENLLDVFHVRHMTFDISDPSRNDDALNPPIADSKITMTVRATSASTQREPARTAIGTQSRRKQPQRLP